MTAFKIDPLKLCAILFVLFFSCAANAHYPVLIGDRSPDMGQRGGIINLTYGLGELYEDVFVDARKPDWVRGYMFDGGTFELTDELKKNGNVYNIKYRSRRVGDTWIVAHVPMTWSKHDNTFTETTVRTIIHQGLSKGWETPLGLPLELVPLNQPYSLLPGDSFRVETLYKNEPLQNAIIYAEKYYSPGLKKPYPTEAVLTRTVRADRNGIANINLHSAGWWVLFVLHELDEMTKDDKSGIATLQDAIWVYVNEMPEQFKQKD